jgi:hypothetical protein
MTDKQDNTGIENSGYYNSGDRNSGDRNSGDRNSGSYNSGYRNSGDRNSGSYNSGYRNSGDSNSGSYNSGIFNTNEPKMRSFNRECDLTYSEFRSKFGYQDINLPINTWVNKEEMTDKEKNDFSTYKEIGGYLKTLSYKEAWAEGWSKATDEQKKWYQSLPNFDANIFLEITSIDVRTTSLKGKKVSVEIDGEKYTATVD